MTREQIAEFVAKQEEQKMADRAQNPQRFYLVCIAHDDNGRLFNRFAHEDLTEKQLKAQVRHHCHGYEPQDAGLGRVIFYRTRHAHDEIHIVSQAPQELIDKCADAYEMEELSGQFHLQAHEIIDILNK